MADATDLALRTAETVQALALMVKPLVEAHPIRQNFGPLENACDDLADMMRAVRNAQLPASAEPYRPPEPAATVTEQPAITADLAASQAQQPVATAPAAPVATPTTASAGAT